MMIRFSIASIILAVAIGITIPIVCRAIAKKRKRPWMPPQYAGWKKRYFAFQNSKKDKTP